MLSHSVGSDFLQPHGLQPTRLLCPWDYPGKSTRIGCHFLLQGIFLTQECNRISTLAGGFFTTSITWEAPHLHTNDSQTCKYQLAFQTYISNSYPTHTDCFTLMSNKSKPNISKVNWHPTAIPSAFHPNNKPNTTQTLKLWPLPKIDQLTES